MYGNTSIKFKITTLVLLSTLIPLLTFYFFGVQSFLNDMENVLARELSTKASLVGKDLDRFIGQRIIDTKTLSKSPVLSSSDITDITEYLKSVSDENPWINEIDVLDYQGNLIADSSGGRIEEEPIWNDYPQLKKYWGTDSASNSKGVYVAETEELDNGEGAGLLFLSSLEPPRKDSPKRHLLIELAFKDIHSVVVNFSEVLKSDKHVYIVKNDGTVMLTDDPSVKPYQMFPDINYHPEMLSFFSEPGARGHLHYTGHKGTPLTAAYADMDEFGYNQGLDWSIIAIASKNLFLKDINTSKSNLLIVGIFLMLAMVIAAYLLSARITSPLLNTITAARNLEAGDYSSQLAVEGSRETRLLAESFNKMSQQIVERNNDLLKSNELKNEFIATASHELRTPLSVVVGYSELLLQNEGLSPEEKREFLKQILDKAFTLDRIVDELLDLSRIETGRPLSLALSQVSVSEVSKQVVKLFQKEKPAIIFNTIFDNENFEITADEGKLSQIFENLIGNAIKFSTDDARVTITGELMGDRYRVSISDNGMGIKPEDHDHIFEKFFRSDSSDTAVHGLGIGLYLTKNLIDLHNGKIWFDSRPGEGTTFYFQLPVNSDTMTK